MALFRLLWSQHGILIGKECLYQEHSDHPGAFLEYRGEGADANGLHYVSKSDMITARKEILDASDAEIILKMEKHTGATSVWGSGTSSSIVWEEWKKLQINIDKRRNTICCF